MSLRTQDIISLVIFTHFISSSPPSELMIKEKALLVNIFLYTVEPRFNEPLNNEDLGITNCIVRPRNSIIHRNEPRYNEKSL